MVDGEGKYYLEFYKDGLECKWKITVPAEVLVNFGSFFSVQFYSENNNFNPIELYPKNIHGLQLIKSIEATYSVRDQLLTESEYNAIKNMNDRNCLIIEFRYKPLGQRSTVGCPFKGNPIFSCNGGITTGKN